VSYNDFLEISLFNVEHIKHRRHSGEPVDDLLRLQFIVTSTVSQQANHIVPPVAILGEIVSLLMLV
jgi:hypothetical protein